MDFPFPDARVYLHQKKKSKGKKYKEQLDKGSSV